ncbi:hypothetical protein F5X96DRAFT_644415, partial [Biscogniauxia mediterranea]
MCVCMYIYVCMCAALPACLLIHIQDMEPMYSMYSAMSCLESDQLSRIELPIEGNTLSPRTIDAIARRGEERGGEDREI